MPVANSFVAPEAKMSSEDGWESHLDSHQSGCWSERLLRARSSIYKMPRSGGCKSLLGPVCFAALDV